MRLIFVHQGILCVSVLWRETETDEWWSLPVHTVHSYILGKNLYLVHLSHSAVILYFWAPF